MDNVYSFHFLSNLYFNNPVSNHSLSMTGTPSLASLFNDFLSSWHDTMTRAGSEDDGVGLINSPPPHWMISWHISGVGCTFFVTWIFKPGVNPFYECEQKEGKAFGNFYLEKPKIGKFYWTLYFLVHVTCDCGM